MSVIMTLQLVIIGGAAALVTGSSIVHAITDTVISTSVRLNRLRVTFTDVKNATTVTDPGVSCDGVAKRVVVYTVPAGGEINSIVTMTNVAFAGPGIASVGIRALRAEQGGVQISAGEIGTPDPDLMDTTYIENRVPNAGEYAFYDENATWDVVAYVCGQDATSTPMSLNGLTAGIADFYIMTTKP